MPPELSPLQATLTDSAIHRGLDSLYRLFTDIGLDLDNTVMDRMKRMKPGQDFVFLDAGCGKGRVAEEFARQMSLRVHRMGFNTRIRTVGLDLNPVPSALFKSWHTQFCKGDIVTMNPLNPSSIDLAVSMRAIQYVDDHLQTLTSGWRVLKRGGTMVWDAHPEALTNPDLEEIIAHTPQANRIFEVRRVSAIRTVIICRKEPGAEFEGFLSYKKLETRKPFHDHEVPHRRFFTESHYEAV